MTRTLLAILPFLVSHAYANKSYDVGRAVYLGVMGGVAKVRWDDVKGLTSSPVRVANNYGFGGRFFVGYAFNNNYGIELGYTRFSNVHIQSSSANTKVRTYAVDLSGKLQAIFEGHIGLYGKLGLGYERSLGAIKLNSLPTIASQNQRHFGVVYSVGTSLYLTPKLVTDISWTRFSGNGKLSNNYFPKADLWAFGLTYKFNLCDPV